MWGLSSLRLLGAWASIELNLIRFVVVLGVHREGSARARLKYFAIQALRSAILLRRLLLRRPSSAEVLSRILTVLALLVKLGAAPFHSWFLDLLKKVSLRELWILSTVQKALPLWLIIQVGQGGERYLVLLNLLVGCGIGLRANSLVLLLGASSLVTLSWVLSSPLVQVGMIYFVMYAFNLGVVVTVARAAGTKIIRGPQAGGGASGESLGVLARVLRLGGIPPMAGFYPKVWVLCELGKERPGLAIALTQATVLFLYLYVMIFHKRMAQDSRGPLITVRLGGLGLGAIVLSMAGPVLLSGA